MLQYLVTSRRKALGLSRQDLATHTGLSISYITMIENGHRTKLTAITRNLLAYYLGVGAGFLEAAERIPPGETFDPYRKTRRVPA
jgi:transcriptional regulator with XRE-family HTH domain